MLTNTDITGHARMTAFLRGVVVMLLLSGNGRTFWAGGYTRMTAFLRGVVVVLLLFLLLFLLVGSRLLLVGKHTRFVDFHFLMIGSCSLFKFDVPCIDVRCTWLSWGYWFP